jgi:deoxyhypusine synthase
VQHTSHNGTGTRQRIEHPLEKHMVPSGPLDLNHVRSIDDLVRAMGKTCFAGREIGEAADVLEAMARDKDCFVVMTLAGAITVAKQDLIISELIDRGIVNAIVSTGTLMAYELIEVPHQNPDDKEELIPEILESWDHNDVLCSYKLNHAIGAHLAKRSKDRRGILKSAYEKGVPVFVPAFTDSELGLDVALNIRLRESTGRHRLRFDPFEDLEHFAATLLRQPRLGVFTIGGGVPSDWSQQFVPFLELRRRRLGENLPLKRYHYCVSINPERVLAGESSSIHSEPVFVPASEGGKFAEVSVDATVGIPLVLAAVLERLGKNKNGTAKNQDKTTKAKPSTRK